MLESLIDALFGCPHRRTTFPITPMVRRRGSSSPVRTGLPYVVCLTCGREFRYSLEQMRIVSEIKRRPDRVTGATAEETQ
jgi:hypothetical protein